MNKVTRILLAVGLILAIATPALAEFKVSGFYRLMGYSTESKAAVGSTTGDAYSQEFITQRFRMQLANHLNENVAVVYQAEVDTDWGVKRVGNDQVGANDDLVGLGGGGQFGADGINVETKNIFLDLKFGDTSARLGVQPFADKVEGVVVNADMAALTVAQKMGATTLEAIYSKWQEGNDWAYSATSKGEWDDQDLYGAMLTHKFSDAFTAGFDVFYVDTNLSTNVATNGYTGATAAAAGDDGTEIFYFGPRASFTTGNFSVDGFVIFQDGEEQKDNGQDISGLAASAKAKMKLEKGDIGLRLIYITEDDDNDEIGAWQGMYDAYEFVNENLMQFLCDPYVTDADKRRYAVAEAAKGGYGLMGAVLSGNHTLPSSMYVKWGVGYFSALEETTNDAQYDRDGKDLGYEVSARVGKKYFDKVDVSLNASYADFGSFYEYDKNAALYNANQEGPDATYQAYLMVNVPF